MEIRIFIIFRVYQQERIFHNIKQIQRESICWVFYVLESTRCLDVRTALQS